MKFQSHLLECNQLSLHDNEFPSDEDMARFLLMLQCISHRPKMYTPNGTLDEIELYIRAWSQGAGYPFGQVNMESGMERFVRWLEDVLECEIENSFHKPWNQKLLDIFGDEESAIRSIGPYYEKYVACD